MWDCKVFKELGIPDFHTEDRLPGRPAESNVWQSVSSPCEQRFCGRVCIVNFQLKWGGGQRF